MRAQRSSIPADILWADAAQFDVLLLGHRRGLSESNDQLVGTLATYEQEYHGGDDVVETEVDGHGEQRGDVQGERGVVVVEGERGCVLSRALSNTYTAF